MENQLSNSESSSFFDDSFMILTAVLVVGFTIYWKFLRYVDPVTSQPSSPQRSPVISPKVPIKKKNGFSQDPAFQGCQTISIFFGSQTGTAEDFANKLAAEGKRHKFNCRVIDMEDYDMDDLENESFVIFVLATYGEGEPTDNAREFQEWLQDDIRPNNLMKQVKYTVFGLGNSTYEHYNKVGRIFDARMNELGAERIFEKGEGNDDSSLEEDFANWKKKLWPGICKYFGIQMVESQEEAQVERKFKMVVNNSTPIEKLQKYLSKKSYTDTTYDAKNPYIGCIMVNRELHSVDSDRSCRHIEVKVGKELNYEVGDHLGIYPENDVALADELARRLKIDPETIFSLVPIARESKLQGLGPTTIRQVLVQWCDITTPPRKSVLRVLAQYASDINEKKKLELLGDDQKQQPYAKLIKEDARTIYEILNDFPSVDIPFDLFLETIPRLSARYYSISSSMKEHPGSVHITAVVVNYVTGTQRKHNGVCSTWLKKQIPQDGIFPPVSCYIHKSSFRLPKNPDIPVVMVGPGTGLAPFRGFIYERKPQHNKGKKTENLLFFGCRSPNKDFIYREELELFETDGHLNMKVAFSRHTDQKEYVQHKMNLVEDEIWQHLHEKGGHFYICGDARSMAKDVHQALIQVVQKKLNYDEAQAESYLSALQKSGKYQTDVWF